MGVDPGLVPPSLDDPGIPGRPQEKGECFTGRVCEVFFNCFGDFEGFLLETCSECRRFKAAEQGIRELILRACKEHLLVTVCMSRERHGKIAEIIVRCGCA